MEMCIRDSRKDGVYAYRRSLNVESLIVVISLSTKERPNPVSGTVVPVSYTHLDVYKRQHR